MIWIHDSIAAVDINRSYYFFVLPGSFRRFLFPNLSMMVCGWPAWALEAHVQTRLLWLARNSCKNSFSPQPNKSSMDLVDKFLKISAGRPGFVSATFPCQPAAPATNSSKSLKLSIKRSPGLIVFGVNSRHTTSKGIFEVLYYDKEVTTDNGARGERNQGSRHHAHQPVQGLIPVNLKCFYTTRKQKVIGLCSMICEPRV